VAAGAFTNRGYKLLLEWAIRQLNTPTNLYIALVTAAVAPTVDINTLGELTEIAAGNGYTAGGFQLTPGATDFDVLTEDDANDLAELEVKDVAWTASSGDIPDSGSGFRYAVLTTDEVTVGDRQVIGWWDLVSTRTIADTQSFTLVDAKLRLTRCP
jgi:hypothetical protein